MSRKPNGHWDNWSNVKKAFQEVVGQLGRFPTTFDLRDLGQQALIRAARLHGGLHAVRDQLGMTTKESRLPRGHWKDLVTAIDAVRPLIEHLDRFPTQTEIREAGLSSVIKPLLPMGGLTALRDSLGWAPITHNLLDRYADQVAEVFMRDPGSAASFEDFLAGLERDCRYERDLRVRLGLPPEPESELATTETT